MYQLGRYSIIVGIILTVIALAVGFGAMFREAEEWAKFFLSVIPIGFLLTFTGLVTVLLTGPRR
ncbi:hypothetical protein [Thioalkalivibrio sulfidiphilus]|jgi:hypothetical protein|uniref:Uncharacterized protein n=1 Tax=Thioalkalivibrio sulfidiphilus (strain HL-EbGR7) TaxID=396588 RepID=B8GRW0_THISH|nr:hypothetical protein [Thioalkalivibrio sulfidiphilus]ACL72664.1 hypothetical protein Tgr7_1580 [Thioalkalivibrio sulfidiphilus HL-EbGr7]